jgi:hypothetical protein
MEVTRRDAWAAVAAHDVLWPQVQALTRNLNIPQLDPIT